MRAASAILTLLLLCEACKSPERTAYVAFGTTTQIANAAIGAYNDYRKTNPVPVEDVRRVRELVQTYVDSVEVAKAAKITYGRAPTDVAQAKLNAALDALAAASSAVITLIESLGVVIPSQH